MIDSLALCGAFFYQIMKVDFYPIDKKREKELKYVIVATRLQHKKWVFVQHTQRNTWELPAGHIEKGETPTEAAKRELYEETGAICYSIYPVCDYSVTKKLNKQYGRLFVAEVDKLGELPDYEIAKRKLSYKLPKNLTYPTIQPILFNKIVEIEKGHPSDDE